MPMGSVPDFLPFIFAIPSILSAIDKVTGSNPEPLSLNIL